MESIVKVPAISATEEFSGERTPHNSSLDLKENYKVKVKKIMTTYQGAKVAEAAAYRSVLDHRSVSTAESKVV